MNIYWALIVIKVKNFIFTLNTNVSGIFVNICIKANVYRDLWKRTSKGNLMKSKLNRIRISVSQVRLAQKPCDFRWSFNFFSLQFTDLGDESEIQKT